MQNLWFARKQIFPVGTALLAALTVLLANLSCGRGDAQPVASLSVGTTTSEVNALILVAQEQGYFASNGLDVSHDIYPSGAAALDGMLNQGVDLATGSEFAFADEVLAGQDIRTIGSISRSSIEYLVGRIDRGINSLADLKGKTIGVPLGSRPEFALDRFLYFQGIDTSQVTLVDVPANRSVEALVSGQVDAVASWQPYIDRITEQMGQQVVSWSVQEDQPSYTLVMCSAQWTVDNPKSIARFLRALVQAEGYMADHPQAVRSFIQKTLNYDEEYMASVWPNYRFSVMLDQTLVVAMEDQARWIISHEFDSEQQTPDLVNYIYADGLEQVKPEAVDIIQ